MLLLTGCATRPPSGGSTSASEVPNSVLGARIAAEAIAQVGRPYRYGGRSPEGFDCSGLVYFVHAALGIAAPRTTFEQFRAARPVAASELRAGDLLFYRIGKTVSHVAIYAGDGRFVHAPQTGRAVELRPLDDPYFQRRLLATGRLY